VGATSGLHLVVPPASTTITISDSEDDAVGARGGCAVAGAPSQGFAHSHGQIPAFFDEQLCHTSMTLAGREEQNSSPSLLLKIDVTTRSKEQLHDGSMPMLVCEVEGGKPIILPNIYHFEGRGMIFSESACCNAMPRKLYTNVLSPRVGNP
jgi:hypothetical protein